MGSRKVIVRGIKASTVDQDLRARFSNFGIIESIEVLPNEEKTELYAAITFVEEKAAKNALAATEFDD